MTEQEDPEFTASHGHTKITTTNRATIYENDLMNNQKDFPQLKV